jgi:hypothetical protein
MARYKAAKVVTTSSPKNDLGGLHYTINHTGKMAGLQSLSSSIVLNPNCVRRMQKQDSICSKCFAAAMMNRYKDLDRCLQENTPILTGSILPDSVLPVIPSRYFRFEAYADLNNWIQFVNYRNIAAKNPDTLCALWTKNPHIIAQALERGYTIPANLQIVLSSPLVNKPIKSTKYAFVDKIFTVYDKKASKGVNINCGARSCLSCGRCYRPNAVGAKIQYINEVLK